MCILLHTNRLRMGQIQLLENSKWFIPTAQIKMSMAVPQVMQSWPD